jgi:hypothetical protein
MIAKLTFTIFFLFLHQIDSKQYKFIAMEQRRMPICEKVKAETCLRRVSQGYNSTMFPNHFNHTNQDDAIKALDDFKPLIEFGCSKYLATFLCSVYLPICTPGLTKPIKPCRSLCKKVTDGCARVVKKHGYEWGFDCNEFPDANNGHDLCLGITSNVGNRVDGNSKKNKGKKNKKKGRRVNGRENDGLDIKCGNNRKIFIKKVVHSQGSSCCRSASKAVLSAMCNGKSKCRFNNSPSSLGGHCQIGSVGKISVRYKCSSHTAERCL